MNVITSFSEKQRFKQLEFERKVLRDLTFSDIEKEAESYFSPFIKTAIGYQTPLEEVCIDYAVESYLLGASYSRFGYYGESLDEVRERSRAGEKKLVDDLYDYWCYWSYADDLMLESIYVASETYVGEWWRRGFENGQKRYRLRLH
ncbi:MAG TPA: DUF2521 family protein [Bacillales bacterium]|nr:DUF2521 family protein [Bacillales bacterium]